MPWYFAIAFPVIFVVLWGAITAILPKFSGWARLEELFPNRTVAAQATLRFQAFYLGRGKLGASYRGCVTFEVCEMGLRVSVWKLFAPFSHPIFIPWDGIETEHVKVFAISTTRMKIGPGGEYWMTIPARSAQNIARASGGGFAVPERG